MVPLSQDGGMLNGNVDAVQIDLPVEGQTAWPQLLRLVAIGSVMMVSMLSFILVLLFSPSEMKIDPQSLMLGLASVVIFEIVIVRRLIIPMNGDYGRWRINVGHVDLYPLSTLGMTVQARPQSIPIGDFSGVAVQSMAVKGSATKYIVTLMHPQRANMVRIRHFDTKVDAESYARMLANKITLPVIAASH